MDDGTWRSAGGWSSNATHNSDNPVWDAWGGSGQSTSGWISDPSATTVRVRLTDGSRVEVDTVEARTTILSYEPDPDRTSIFEILDGDGTVLHVVPFG
jgi:hypothetical protein